MVVIMMIVIIIAINSNNGRTGLIFLKIVGNGKDNEHYYMVRVSGCFRSGLSSLQALSDISW